MLAKDIKNLPFVLHYQGSVNNWEGKTSDSMEEIIKKGYCEVYPAYSCSKSHSQTQYKKCNVTYVPLHRIYSLHHK